MVDYKAVQGLVWPSVLIVVIGLAYRPLIQKEDWNQVCGEWDDRANFIDNELVRKPLDFVLLNKMFRVAKINVYEPFGWLLKACVQSIEQPEENGLLKVQAWAHRITSLFIHSMTSVLVYCITLRILRKRQSKESLLLPLSVMCATLAWAAHPMHAEVIGWISAQPYTLAMFFYMCAVWNHLVLLEEEEKQRFLLRRRLYGALWYALASLSKSVVVPAPATIVAIELVLRYDVLKDTPFTWLRNAFIHLLPYASIAAIMIPVTMEANHLGRDPSADVIQIDSFRQRAAKSIITIWFCLGKALWPTKLSPHYVLQGPEPDYSELILASTATVTTLSIAISLCLARAFDRGAILALFIHVFALFLPGSGLVQHGMIQKGGDRYAYAPLVAFVPALASLLFSALKICAENKQAISIIGLILASATVIFCETQLTAHQVVIWRNDVTLLQHAIALDPYDWRCLDTLGEFLLRNGDPGATPLLERALRSVDLMPIPSSAKLAVFRGKNLVLTGDVDQGCQLFHEAKLLYPDSPLPHNNAAICDLRHPDLVPLQRENFEMALRLSYREEQVNGALANVQAYDQWQARNYQGVFDGTLLY